MGCYQKLEDRQSPNGGFGKNSRTNQKVWQGDFLLRLDAAFPQHWETHLRLRPGGDWSDGENGPKTATEWALVESYMGLFERIQALIEFGIVDLDTFARFYGYRVLNIDNNPIIHNTKLEGEIAEYWADFIKLRDAVRHKRARPTDTMGISTQATKIDSD